MQKYKHKARKRFGQNFLINADIIDKIIQVIAPKKDDNLVEIGPGKGAITLPLLEKSGKLQVIEIDTDLIKILQSLQKNNLCIHHHDVLTFDFNTLVFPMRIVGNLPYNISSPLLFYLLKHKEIIVDMIFMLQKQLAQRITANKGNKTYGRLSVIMQAFFQTEMIFTIPPQCFQPIPKVDSALIYFKPRKNTGIKNKDIFTKVVKIAFLHRRKTLQNCLKTHLNQQQTNIDLSLRAEMLSVNDFITLSDDYEKQH